MANFYNPVISEETFAAWLDGALTSEQEAMFLDTCSHNEELQELLDANDQVEEDYEDLVESGFVIPSEFEGDFDIPQITMIFGSLWNAFSSLTNRSMSEKYIFSVAKCFFSG